MLNPWFAATLLALEATDVMHLRMWRLAGGGGSALEEAQLMISEKLSAAVETLSSVMLGRTPISIIERYRELVAANALRLSM
jgi:hypothetical protein